MKTIPVWLLFLSFAIVPGVHGESPSATDIIQKSHLAFYYAGNDGKAKVLMKLINKSGGERKRELTMLRKNESQGGNQKYYSYFHNPPDVRATVFMVYKYPHKNDDRWLFVPALNLIQRIAAKDSRSSFVGSDFTYEDVSGRDLSSDTHKFLREELHQGRDCYVIESTPRGRADYVKKISWIDRSNYLPIKEDYYDTQGDLYRTFTADSIQSIQGIPTVMKRTMKNLKSGHRTEVRFQTVEYNIGIDDDLFSERSLRRPPQKWIQ
ncbi:MAG: hypothetical protein A3H42_02800 [Deltaproteobacteria bacterium RIFCSPLOWO2_02_FULL_46_8]|nr:MAG: hypothetical protein A3H42_02800 [Deltaproteobacteria bacterium RIFCSPLOWO2_02_FULL_46_8]